MTNTLSPEAQEKLLTILEQRFLENIARHPDLEWGTIQTALQEKPNLLRSLNEMEQTGGEPDIVGKEPVFIDCSKESPKGRRSICYDREALDKRKKNKPANDARTLADEMGVELLTEEEYKELQTYGEFDLKTSTWIQTPDKIRTLGGALYGDRRYDTVFTYHNGAESYYASRGFRAKLKI